MYDHAGYEGYLGNVEFIYSTGLNLLGVCMGILKRYVDIDLSAFKVDDDQTTARYGLPKDVKFCKRCVIPNQRPNTSKEYAHSNDSKHMAIIFDEEGVCDACRVAEMKQTIDWDARSRELKDLCDRYRRNDGNYDCIVPGSGGKDSFAVSWLLKTKYGMHPLTITWAPHIYTDWGWHNFKSWIHSGFDNHLVTPNGKVHRLLTRLATENIFHPFQPFTLGQKSCAVNLAMLMDIKLVFYGDHAAEWGTPKEHFNSPYVNWDLFKHDDSELHIGGVSVGELKENYGLTDNDLLLYMPFDMDRMQEKKIEAHCMPYYHKWHMQDNYYNAVEHGGFKPSPERTSGTYSKYTSIDDKMDDFNFFTAYIKFGFGRASTDASQEIRMGDITREEGIALVRRYDGEYPERFAEEFFEYVSITEKDYPEAHKMFEQPRMDRAYFDHLADRFRSPHIWRHENGAWSLRHAVWQN